MSDDVSADSAAQPSDDLASLLANRCYHIEIHYTVESSMHFSPGRLVVPSNEED